VGNVSHKYRKVSPSGLERVLSFLVVWGPKLESLPHTGSTRERSAGGSQFGSVGVGSDKHPAIMVEFFLPYSSPQRAQLIIHNGISVSSNVQSNYFQGLSVFCVKGIG